MLFPAPVIASLRDAPSEPALQDGSRTVSRGELLGMVWRLVGGLRDVGVRPGMGVGMVLTLSPEAYAAHLAAHVLGCRVATARPGWGARQLAGTLWGHSDVVVADQPVDGPALRLDDLLSHRGPGACAAGLADPDGIARLTYTSGSTGRPKACAHTYRAISLAYQPEQWPPVLARLLTGAPAGAAPNGSPAAAGEETPRAPLSFERCLIHQSLASPAMFTYLGRTLVVGGMAVLPGGLALPEAVERYRITATIMPPPRLHALIQSGADLSSLRALVLGGSPAGSQLLRAATERLGPIVWQGYGQGEAGIISMLTPQDILAGHEASVGRPVPTVEVDIRDGEVCVRSPHLMAGYWDDPEQTRDVLRDGWLHTRDLGYLDDAGLLHLTGRTRDVIMVNAEVCYAGAIERVLATHPAVAEAYVAGAPDPDTGEAIHAFVVPAGDMVPDREVLAKLVREQLSANNVPATLTVVSQVPVSPSGKPDKRALLALP
ncbi:MAG TPA: fatty acid--CoA ligase family protein [Micromonosporaceae bacterium]|nr:fatty acid--CoA ligase family protein [Micromonosporaceae bacterium]